MSTSTNNEQPEYAQRRGSPSEPRRWVLRVAVIVTVLICAGALAVTLSRTSGDSGSVTQVGATPTTQFVAGTCDAPAPRPDHPSQQQIDEWAADARAVNDEIAKTGFAKTRAIQQDGSSICAWFRPSHPTFEQLEGKAASSDATALYDQPNGNVLGVAYMYLGYFPFAVVTAPGFDPGKLRMERFGCDPVSDPTCRPPNANPMGKGK